MRPLQPPTSRLDSLVGLPCPTSFLRHPASHHNLLGCFLTPWFFFKMPGSFYLLLNILHLYLLFSLTISNLFNKISGNFIFCVDLFYGSCDHLFWSCDLMCWHLLQR